MPLHLPLPGWTRTVRLSAAGDARPSVAWERYALPSAWASWSPQIRSVEASTERIAVGTTGRVHGWGTPPVAFAVAAVDEVARTWAWDVRLGPVALHLDHGVEARPGGGSRTWLRVRGALPVVLGYAPLARVALSRVVA